MSVTAPVSPIEISNAALRWCGSASDEALDFADWYVRSYALDAAGFEDLPDFPVAWRRWLDLGQPR